MLPWISLRATKRERPAHLWLRWWTIKNDSSLSKKFKICATILRRKQINFFKSSKQLRKKSKSKNKRKKRRNTNRNYRRPPISKVWPSMSWLSSASLKRKNESSSSLDLSKKRLKRSARPSVDDRLSLKPNAASRCFKLKSKDAKKRRGVVNKS